ncbi:serine/threonine protein kinase, partial [Hyalangium sp.]|uniref:serine/threonine protein kinase n=1 Tax=Hyalangium sp. TaxID=2028555 RepID=UPI002D414035
VKRENIMVRLPSEEPVVLDFGLAALAGASSSMGVGQVTGTLEYVSPEAWRHACEEEEHYRPTAKDEQWALGVTFYWMLTDLLAFGGREDPLMTRRVLREQPKAPHVVNPRVPPELGALCMRLLEKNPEDRYADLKELCGAVRQVLEKAVDGAAWDVPLGQPDAPECRTTDIDVTVVAEGGIDLLLALIRAPRRGRVIQLPATRLLAVPPPVPLPEPAPVPAPVPIQRIAELPAVMAAVPAPAAWGRPVPALQGARRAASWTLLLLLGLVLGPEVSSVLGEPPARAPAPVLFEEPALWPGGPSNSLQPAGAGPPFVAWQVGSPGEKLASPPYPPQSGVGADKTPASAVEAAYREKEPHVKKSSAARKAVITLCTALTSCVGAPQIMRQDPPAEPCPPGAIKAMAEWMDIEFEFGFALPPEPNVFMPVKEGPFTAEAWSRRTTWKWQGGKVEGKIIFGPDRVHIRLTKAFTYDGKAFPICAQVHHLTAKEGEPHVILSTQSAKIVDRFE